MTNESYKEEEQQRMMMTTQDLTEYLSKAERMNYRASCGPLELVGRDGSDGGAPSALVRNPVERILGRILTIASQTAPAKATPYKKRIRDASETTVPSVRFFLTCFPGNTIRNRGRGLRGIRRTSCTRRNPGRELWSPVHSKENNNNKRSIEEDISSLELEWAGTG